MWGCSAGPHDQPEAEPAAEPEAAEGAVVAKETEPAAEPETEDASVRVCPSPTDIPVLCPALSAPR